MRRIGTVGSAPRLGTSGGFTLVELLLATALSAVLMSAVLSILAALSRDRVRLDKARAVPATAPILDRIQWDIRNAVTMSELSQGLVLIGHGGIDPKILTPNGRLTRVTYRTINEGGSRALVREQAYLDDPFRPQPWRGIVAVGVTDLTVSPESGMARDSGSGLVEKTSTDNGGSGTKPAPPINMPVRVRIHLDRVSGAVDAVISAK